MAIHLAWTLEYVYAHQHNSEMPRQPRYFLADIPQHVIQRGVDKQAVFFRPNDYRLYLRALAEAAARYECLIHAYVLMVNHTHLLVTPLREKSIPQLMQAMGRDYVQALNKSYGRSGTLWEGRYRASLVQDDKYLLTCYRYIELNPVRAGIVTSPGDYPYSSYGQNALGIFDPLISMHPIYEALAGDTVGRLSAYRRLFNGTVSPELLTTIRTATNSCLVLGNSRFQDQIERVLGRSVRHKKSGRPRKTPD